MSQEALRSTDIQAVETERYFEMTLLESLDPASEDYLEDRTKHERNIQALENRIEELETMSYESPRAAMRSRHDANLATNSSSSSSLFDPYSNEQVRKRPRETTFSSPQAATKFPRMTPSPSISGTSTPGSDSFDLEEGNYGLGHMRQPNLAGNPPQRQREADWTPSYGRGQSLGQELRTPLPLPSRPHPSSAHSTQPRSYTPQYHSYAPQSAPPGAARLGLPAQSPAPHQQIKPEASRASENHSGLYSHWDLVSDNRRPSDRVGQISRPSATSLNVIDLTGDSDDEPQIVQPQIYHQSNTMPPQRHTQPQYQREDPFADSYLRDPVYGLGVPGPAYARHQQPLQQLGQYASSAWGSVRGLAHEFQGGLRDVGNLLFPGGAPNYPYTIDDTSRMDDYDNRGWNETPAETSEQLRNLLENIDGEEEDKEETPFQLNIDLKEHQKIGLAWLKKMEEGTNKGGILADDMGLGKTVQALALILLRPSADTACKTTLIIAPLALMRQWEKEMKTKVHEKHRLSVYIYHGANKRQDFQYLRGFDVVMSTYGTLASELRKREKWTPLLEQNPQAKIPSKERFPLLANSSKWYRVILDEAQNIKNKDTLTSKAAGQLKAITRICMTGTPMMNNVIELYSLIRFLDIKPYCYWKRFREDISTPINKWKGGNEPAMEKLRILWKAISLRRKKDSKINGQPIIVIPPKVVEEVHVVFDEHQKSLYDALEQKAQIKFNRYLKAGKVLNNYAHMLVLLLRLRQACCHPHLITDLSVEAPGNMTSNGMKELAAAFKPEVVQRIIDQDGNFQCPICLDATENPCFSFPCGHSACLECYSKIVDPANAAQNGDDDPRPKCPSCRDRLDANKVVDYVSFCRVHLPDKFPPEESSDAGSDSEEDSEVEEEEEEDLEDDDSLDGFIVKDDEEADPDAEVKYSLKQKAAKARRQKSRQKKSQAREKVKIKLFSSDDEGKESKQLLKGEPSGSDAPFRSSRIINDDEDQDGPLDIEAVPKTKAKSRKSGTKKPPKMTLAQLKKESHRSIAARRKYLKRLARDWVTSAKLEKTMEILQSVRDNDPKEKIIIFSQWTSLLDLLEIPINKAGWGYQRYDGSMKPSERVEAVEEFTESPKCTILLTSLKAGNSGLNLHQASQVIMLDPFWNPYIEEQAVDRAHRFPQEKTVHVHRILVDESVEDRIMALQEKKKQLIEAAMDETAGKNIAKLGIAQFGYLFGINGYNVNSR